MNREFPLREQVLAAEDEPPDWADVAEGPPHDCGGRCAWCVACDAELARLRDRSR